MPLLLRSQEERVRRVRELFFARPGARTKTKLLIGLIDR